MNNFEISSCLDSMEIIVDSNEQPSERAFKRYETFGVPYRVQKIDYGDYTYNFMLPNGKWIYEPNTRLYPPVSIERKADLVELSQCFCQSRERFAREFERAKQNEAKIYLLVENASWENLINGKYATKYNPKAYLQVSQPGRLDTESRQYFANKRRAGRLLRKFYTES